VRSFLNLSFIFPDGLYVLLKAAKKPKDKSKDYPVPHAPAHLAHLVWKDALPENCPWSLSGPQYSHQTAIQQRYCYPKGSPEYSRTKGGALWTMYNAEGKEDDEFRLLHVYYSVKRASNREGDKKKGRKRAKRSPKSSPQSSPMRFGSPSMFHSPNTIASSSTMSSSMFERSPMVSPQGSVDLTNFWPRGDIRNQSYISSTINDMGNRSLGSRSFKSGISDDLSMSPHGSYASGHTSVSMPAPAMASPFRRPIHTDALSSTVSPLQRTGNHGPVPSAGAPAAMPQQDYSDLWNEPILSYDEDDNDEYSFSSQLQEVSSTIRERIRHAPAQEQSNLLTQMSEWARKLAQEDPSTDNNSHQELQHQLVTSPVVATATRTETPSIESHCSI
jgi:hypothetical protein